MPNSIDAYFQSLLSVIADSLITRTSNVSLDKRASRAGFIRGDLYFADGSRLHFRELVELQDVAVRRRYSYHYQKADDAPHFPDLPDFPHHKHIGDEDEVMAAKPPDLTTALLEIETLFAWPPSPANRSSGRVTAVLTTSTATGILSVPTRPSKRTAKMLTWSSKQSNA